MSFGCIDDFLFRRIVVCSMVDCALRIHRATYTALRQSGFRLSDTFGIGVVGRLLEEAWRSSIITFNGEKMVLCKINYAFYTMYARLQEFSSL